MNENELSIVEDENTSANLYTVDEVEKEEDDGPGFGLGVLIGTGIGIAATAVAKKVVTYVKSKRQMKRPSTDDQEDEYVVVEEVHDTKNQEPTVLDMTKNKGK